MGLGVGDTAGLVVGIAVAVGLGVGDTEGLGVMVGVGVGHFGKAVGAIEIKGVPTGAVVGCGVGTGVFGTGVLVGLTWAAVAVNFAALAAAVALALAVAVDRAITVWLATAVKKASFTTAVCATTVPALLVAGTSRVGLGVGGTGEGEAVGSGTGVTVGKFGLGVMVGKAVGSRAGGEGVTTIVTAGRVLVATGVSITATAVRVTFGLELFPADRARITRKAINRIMAAGIKTIATLVGLVCLAHQVRGRGGGVRS